MRGILIGAALATSLAFAARPAAGETSRAQLAQAGAPVVLIFNHGTHRLNEKICWGAWRLSDTDRYWGVGYENSHRCQRCCWTCNGATTGIENLDPAR